MALLVFEHHPKETPARLGEILRDFGHKLRIIRPYAGDAMPADLDNVDGVLSLGGPMNADEHEQHPWIPREVELIRQAHEAGLPVVGVCLGAQFIAAALGGEVAAMAAPEFGWHNVRLAFPGTIDPLTAGIPWNTIQFHLHSQEVTKLPAEATPLAGSQMCRTQAFKVGLTTYAFQYHFALTRRDIEGMLEMAAADITHAGGDVQAIRAEIDEYEALYRHIGDRQCGNLAQLLFPIDKRLAVRRTLAGTG